MTDNQFTGETLYRGDPIRGAGSSSDELGSLPVVQRTDDGSWRLNITPAEEAVEALETGVLGGTSLGAQQVVDVCFAATRLRNSASRTGQHRRTSF